jgi:VWFA-related protein
MKRFSIYLILLLTFAISAPGQSEFRVTKQVTETPSVEIINLSGRVSIDVQPRSDAAADAKSGNAVTLIARSEKGVTSNEIKLDAGPKTTIEVEPAFTGKQIDITVSIPVRSRVSVETSAGAVDVSGNFESIYVKTGTGTVSTDIPDDAISYDLQWSEAKPRFLADFQLAKVKEGSAGRFSIKGKFPDKPKDKPKEQPKKIDEEKVVATTDEPPAVDETEKPKKKKKVKDEKDDSNRRDVSLKVSTARGIVLLNVDESEVGSDLRERPLTTAAKSIIRSGDTFLMEAIRRASPKYFGEYMRTLPPPIREPYLSEKTSATNVPAGEIKTMSVNVLDSFNRSIGDLSAEDFEVTENGESREVLSVKPVTAPFNLVLLLDVSGSVDNYVNFIRKAARQFVETMGPQDRIAIVSFNDDVHVISRFTTDKAELSKSLDTFDAGGGTAYYDALAYVLADTLRPMRGDRTAIVVLTDGDDNRSFLPFDALKGTIQESGALIYPLYVPSSLIAASATNQGQDNSIDWLRRKYMGLTVKAEGEGEKLAKASGGVYYPITQLGQIQTAYDDIAKQLRTAYSVTFRSAANVSANTTAQSRLRIKVKRDNAFVKFANQ